MSLHCVLQAAIRQISARANVMHARQAITTPVNQDRPHAINAQWTAAAKTRLKNQYALAVAHLHRIGGRQRHLIGDRALQDGITTGSLLHLLIMAGLVAKALRHHGNQLSMVKALRHHGNQLSMVKALRHHGNQLRMVRAATHIHLKLWAVDKESRIVSNDIFTIIQNFN